MFQSVCHLHAVFGSVIGKPLGKVVYILFCNVGLTRYRSGILRLLRYERVPKLGAARVRRELELRPSAVGELESGT